LDVQQQDSLDVRWTVRVSVTACYSSGG
jgi:hypothetical protein